MSRRLPRLRTAAVCAVLASLFLVFAVASTAYADEKPYFRTLNSGAFAGGWFKDSSGSCESNYQRPSFSTSTTVDNEYNGAIMAWANSNRAQSAGSSLDAFAVGLIEGDGDPEYGFYTGLSGTSALSFANFESFDNVSNPPFWGGIFEGAVLNNAHCIPDYYETNIGNATGGWPGPSAFTSGGIFTYSGTLNLTSGLERTIPGGTKLTLFVIGNVIIDRNIFYGAHNITNVPKFELVVRGNIYINPAATQLDGWYIAQPDGTSGGVIWTCSNGSEPLPDTYIRTNCDSTLVINGALTAKQINLTRIDGNIGTTTVAETVNFTPEMVLGGPFFEDETPGTAGSIQSLISLPPVF